jgi:maltose O-acetyltransferase
VSKVKIFLSKAIKITHITFQKILIKFFKIIGIVKWDFLYECLLIFTGLPEKTLLFKLREECHNIRLKSHGSGGYYADTIFSYPTNIIIGNNVTFGGRVSVNAMSNVCIGDNCMIAYGTIITTATHDPCIKQMNEKTLAKPVNLGNNVWIGTGAIILPGISIADGVIIAAGSVVTHSISEEDVIVGGIPAKIIKKRSIIPETIKEIES